MDINNDLDTVGKCICNYDIEIFLAFMRIRACKENTHKEKE